MFVVEVGARSQQSRRRKARGARTRCTQARLPHPDHAVGELDDRGRKVGSWPTNPTREGFRAPWKGSGPHDAPGRRVVGGRLAATPRRTAPGLRALRRQGERSRVGPQFSRRQSGPPRGGREPASDSSRAASFVGRASGLAVAQEIEDHATVVALLPSPGRRSSSAPPREPLWPAIIPRVWPVRRTRTRPALVASAFGKVIDSTPLP